MSLRVPSNVFDLAAGNPELLGDIKGVKEALHIKSPIIGPFTLEFATLNVVAVNGFITFRLVDEYTNGYHPRPSVQIIGCGQCSKTGAGIYRHSDISFRQAGPLSFPKGETFTLVITADKANLTLGYKGRFLLEATTYTGEGKGIDGAWTGKWEVESIEL